MIAFCGHFHSGHHNWSGVYVNALPVRGCIKSASGTLGGILVRGMKRKEFPPTKT
jgi:hypothetical protein